MPLFIVYDMEGKELSRVNLRAMALDGVRKHDNIAKRNGIKKISELKGSSFKTMIYCCGFAVDKHDNVYYVMRDEIYCFNRKLKLFKRYIFSKKIHAVFYHAFTDNKGLPWVTAAIQSDLFLLNLSKDILANKRRK